MSDSHATEVSRGSFEGTDALTLSNAHAALVVLPDAGARIASLQSRTSGREWLWRTADRRPAQGHRSGTPFEQSPLLGIDECLPTVGACELDGVRLPDHGEAWSARWAVNEAGLARGELTTTLELQTLPLVFSRTITLHERTITLAYRLHNRGARSVRYVWALHALFQTAAGDTVQIPGTPEVHVTASAGNALPGGTRGAWPLPGTAVRLDRWDLGTAGPAYLKAFVRNEPPGRIAIANERTGDRLELVADPLLLPAWGYWATLNGAWHGHTHVALEPTNAAVESADLVRDADRRATLAAGEERCWRVQLVV